MLFVLAGSRRQDTLELDVTLNAMLVDVIHAKLVKHNILQQNYYSVGFVFGD